MSEYILELDGITKKYGSTVALNGMQFRLKAGEIHALMGENGAGKSTFIKIITGVLHPDYGSIILDGKDISPKNALESQKMGIAAIYQHATAFPDLSVTENIFMGREIKTKLGILDRGKMNRLAREYLAPFAPDIDVTKPMSSLGVARQQLVEIAKALSQNAKILILDEPTASLTKYECEELYRILERLRDKGVSMIFITHKFEDMYRLATRVTVLRDAQYIGTYDVDSVPNDELIAAMVGRKLDKLYPERTAKIGDELFRVEGLSKTGYFRDVSFGVKRGEIVALTGLVGAGRTEVCQTIFGIMKPDSGRMFLDGKEIRPSSPAESLGRGIGLLPEDRLTQGLVRELPIYQNVTVSDLGRFVRMGLLSKKDEKERAAELCGKLDLKASSIEANPSSLSGGNQQKVVLAKLINCPLKVLIVDEPTKGIDVGAKYSVYETLCELVAGGYGIIMVSSEMPEVLGMADRIIVMKSGRVSAIFDRAEATQDKILKAALYGREDREAEKETVAG